MTKKEKQKIENYINSVVSSTLEDLGFEFDYNYKPDDNDTIVWVWNLVLSKNDKGSNVAQVLIDWMPYLDAPNGSFRIFGFIYKRNKNGGFMGRKLFFNEHYDQDFEQLENFEKGFHNLVDYLIKTE